MINLQSSRLAVIVLLIASTLWGLSWIPLKFFKEAGIEGMWLLFISHCVLAFLFILPGLKLQSIKQNYLPLVGIAFFGGSAILLFTLALTYGDVIRMMVLFYLLPVWGVFGGRLFLGETLDKRRWFGVIVAVLGAFIFLGGVNVIDKPPTWMDLIALLSGLFFAANNIIFRGVEPVSIPTKLLAMFVGCTFISAALIVIGIEKSTPNLTMPNSIWLIAYILLWLLAANVGSQWAVTKLEAGRSSIILIMELVAAVISSLLLGMEVLTLTQWFGCVLVVTAGYLEASR